MNRKNEGGAVYRTGVGRLCPGCERALSDCTCKRRAKEQRPRQLDGIVRIGRETKGRKGAGVTVVDGLPLTDTALRDLAKSLKKQCGVGGSVKGTRVELQGDQRARLEVMLKELGYTVKLSGG